MSSWQDYMVTNLDESREIAWVEIYEDTDSFLQENMKTEPGTPLSAIDANEEELYLNREEYWSLVSESLKSLETAGQRLGYRREFADESSEFESVEEYVDFLEFSGLDTEILEAEEMETLIEESESTQEDFSEYFRPDHGYNPALDDLR